MAVILYHAFPNVSPNGFAGVDVFFVLSGFLITKLLLREYTFKGRVSLRHFYMRRILRLYPALILAAVGVSALGALQGEFRAALPGVVSALTYMSHITISLGASSGLLAHTWTLSLEEHYYLFWPVVLLGIMRGGRWRVLGVVALAGLILLIVPGVLPVSLGSMYWRALAMMVGSLTAVVLHQHPGLASHRAWAPLGLISMIFLSVVILAPVELSRHLAQGPFAFPAVLSVIVIISFIGHPSSIGARALGFCPLSWLGKRAYGLYLYHFPIILSPLVPGVFERVGVEAPLIIDLFVGLSITVLVAWASYRWVEEPFLRLKDRFRGGASVLVGARPSTIASKNR